VTDFPAFDAEATGFFELDEARCTVALTILAGGRSGVHRDARLYRVDDREGARLFAMRTPPFPLVVARGDAEAAAALGAFVAAADPTLPGVTGPTELARATAAGVARPIVKEVAMRLYVCRAVSPPARPAEGDARPAEGRDVDRLVELYDGFAREAGVALPAARETIERAIREARLFVWEDGGEVVSLTQRTVATGRSTRVNLVYTPDAHRGRGYASSLVAHVTQTVLDAGGGAFACLFTDLANPTSNAIYQAIGYAPVSDFAELRF
jgi:predicted GNAT family acetyltransferase